MPTIVVTRNINAPVGMVFETVANIENMSKAAPHIVGFEFISDTKSGIGTRFRETRLMGDKAMTTELEVTEFEPGRRVRMVADSNGTIWDTLFEVAREGGSSLLTVTMEARAYKLLSRLMNPLIKGIVRKAVEKDMDLVKAYCETHASTA